MRIDGAFDSYISVYSRGRELEFWSPLQQQSTATAGQWPLSACSDLLILRTRHSPVNEHRVSGNSNSERRRSTACWRRRSPSWRHGSFHPVNWRTAPSSSSHPSGHSYKRRLEPEAAPFAFCRRPGSTNPEVLSSYE